MVRRSVIAIAFCLAAYSSIRCAASEERVLTATSTDERLLVLVEPEVLRSIYQQYCAGDVDRDCAPFDQYNFEVQIGRFSTQEIRFELLNAFEYQSSPEGLSGQSPPGELSFVCGLKEEAYDCVSDAHR
ncbi:MAG: hypothetical protein GC189_03240 [Alphaproteobacteria bacterium]|nr:hypothetical protein [Alphaproteobacteria bacterium]